MVNPIPYLQKFDTQIKLKKHHTEITQPPSNKVIIIDSIT